MKGVAKKKEKLKGREGDTLAGIVGDTSWGSQDLNNELTHSSKLNTHKGAGSHSGGYSGGIAQTL